MNCLLVGALKQNEGHIKICPIKFSMCVCMHLLGNYYIKNQLGIILNTDCRSNIYRLMNQGINIAMRILDFRIKNTQ